MLLKLNIYIQEFLTSFGILLKILKKIKRNKLNLNDNLNEMSKFSEFYTKIFSHDGFINSPDHDTI
jgi:hypothetical protein